MGADRVDALPLLDERQAFKDRAIPSLSRDDIDMAIMRQTPRLGTRPRAMLGAERDHALAMLGSEDDVAGDEDHLPYYPKPEQKFSTSSQQITSAPVCFLIYLFV